MKRLAENLFKRWNDRFEVHLFRQEAEGDEVLGEGIEVAIDQVHHRLNQARSRFAGDLAHHPEIEIGQAPIGQGQQVAGMGISVEKAVFEQLLQAAVHANIDQLIRVDPHGLDRLEPGQLHPLDPFHGQHPPAGEFAMDFRNGDARVVGVQLSEALGIGGFVEVVHFLKYPPAQLIDEGHQVAADQADVGFQPRRDIPHDVEVQRDLLPQTGPLHFHGHGAAIFQGAPIHLAQGGG